MSADGSIELLWGDGPTRFRLAIAQLLALEEKFDAGCQQILDRFRNGTWRLSETREILRLGLIGADHGMQSANRLIDVWFDKMGVPPLEHASFAMVVLMAGLTGPSNEEDDDAGEPKAETTASEANASSPPRSTARAPSSDGRRATSTPAGSGRSRPPSKGGMRRKAAKTKDIPTP